MTRPDPYESLALRYDRMRSMNPERAAFLRDLFQEHGVRRLLDCACGTGQDLVLFSEMGLDCTGSDLSAAMLAQARVAVASAGPDIPLVQADFRFLPDHFAQPFDAVVCLSNSINELLEEADTLAALRSMRQVLRPGGLLVLDQGQTDRSIGSHERFVPIVNDRDFTRIFDIDIDEDRRIQTVHILDALHTDEATEFHTSSVRLRIRLEQGWRTVLTAAGMTNIRILGGWNGADYDPRTSRRLIAVCRKLETPYTAAPSPFDADLSVPGDGPVHRA